MTWRLYLFFLPCRSAPVFFSSLMKYWERDAIFALIHPSHYYHFDSDTVTPSGHKISSKTWDVVLQENIMLTVSSIRHVELMKMFLQDLPTMIVGGAELANSLSVGEINFYLPTTNIALGKVPAFSSSMHVKKEKKSFPSTCQVKRSYLHKNP